MVRPRSPSEEHRQAAEAANALLVRWANAAFHLVVLDDVRGGSAAQLKEEMVRTRKLLTAGEWEADAYSSSVALHYGTYPLSLAVRLETKRAVLSLMLANNAVTCSVT